MEFFEAWQEAVFRGEEETAAVIVLPWDGEGRIVVSYAAFALRMVVVVALIAEDRMVFEDDKSMGESSGDVKLGLVLAGEQDAFPLSEGGGVFAKVDSDIVDTAADDTNEFGLGTFDLQMQSSKDSFAGAGFVALDEGTGDNLMVDFFVVGLEEVTSLVFENSRSDDIQVGDLGRLNGYVCHGGSSFLQCVNE